MAITIGPVIGYAEVTGQSYVDVPVTTAVPVGDPTTAHGVVAVAVSREEYGTNPFTGDSGSLANKYPVVTDDRPTSAPYNLPNKMMGTLWWTGNSTGAPGGDPYGSSHGNVTFLPPGMNPTNYTFRGAYHYLMLAGLEVGDTVRVDYTGQEGSNVLTPLSWLAVRLHRIDGLHAENEPNPVSPWYGEPFESAVTAGLPLIPRVYPDSSNPDPTGFNLGWNFGDLQFMWGYTYYAHRDAWEPAHDGEEFFHFKVTGEFDIDQQYKFHNVLATSGAASSGLQIGYAFHDWEGRIGSANPAVISYRGNSPDFTEANYWGITQVGPGPGWPIPLDLQVLHLDTG